MRTGGSPTGSGQPLVRRSPLASPGTWCWREGHTEGMRTLGNILWLLVAGIWLALGYVAAGILNCILIITIPFGIASFRLARYALWPFGRTVVRKPTSGAMSVIGNVIWFVISGLWLAIGHIIAGIILCVFIITIPFG